MASKYHHGDLRAASVAAGLQILDTEGIEALGLRAVARSVGVSHAAPLRHFPDRAALIAAVAAVGYEQLADAMQAARDAADDPALGLLGTGLAYVGFAVEYPHRFRILGHPAIADRTAYPQLAHASVRAFDVLRDAVVGAQVAGAARSGSTLDIALTAWCAVHGLANLALDHQLAAKGFHSPIPELAATMLGQIYEGIHPR